MGQIRFYLKRSYHRISKVSRIARYTDTNAFIYYNINFGKWIKWIILVLYLNVIAGFIRGILNFTFHIDHIDITISQSI